MAHPVRRLPAARTVIRWQQCVLPCGNTAAAAAAGSAAAAAAAAAAGSAAAAVLSLATLEEVQHHNRNDEVDEGSPGAKRTLCSRKIRDEDVCLSTA